MTDPSDREAYKSRTDWFHKKFVAPNKNPGRIRTAVSELPGRLAAQTSKVPLGFIGSGAKSLLLGKKNANFASPFHGMRKSPIKGHDGLRPISRVEYEDLIQNHGRKGRALAVSGTVDGRPAYYRRAMQHGGMVGFAQKHPILTGAGGLLAYYLATSPGARQVAGSVLPGVASPTPDAIRQLTPNTRESPFARDAWG